MLASTFAMADLCDEAAGGSTGCAVYNVKFTFKTLAAKDARCSATQLASAACTALLAGGEVGIAYLDNATRKFEGILWQCAGACFDGTAPGVAPAVAPGVTVSDINYVLWEKKSEKAISGAAEYTAANEVKWTGNTTSGADKENTKFDILGRYGNRAQKVAAFWTPSMADANEVIYAAGFGTFDARNYRIKSVSGNAVGKLVPIVATTGNTCGDENLLSVMAYMCGDFKSWCCCDCVAAAIAPASGTWSVKYNSSLSRGSKRLDQILPSYAWVRN